MKRILLVASHVGANSDKLISTLENKRTQLVRSTAIYEHPSILCKLITEHPYSIYLGDVLYNIQMPRTEVYQMCDFIYLVRNPRFLKLDKLLTDYYVFRLRRLYEMARVTGGIFLTWDDVVNGKGLRLIEREYGFSKMSFDGQVEQSVINPPNLLQEAERAYELCLYRMGKLSLSRTNSL